MTVSVVEKLNRQRPWDEKFEVDYLFVQDEDYNKPEIIEKLFNKEHDIAYIKIPAMISRSKAALFLIVSIHS